MAEGELDIGEACLEYFRQAYENPYSYETKVDKYGNEKQTKVPCDFPSYAGFAASVSMGKDQVLSALGKDVKAQCDAMIEHILLVNGMNGSYASALSVRATENIMGWSQKIEQTGVSYTVSPEDLKLLRDAGLKVADRLIEGVAERLA